MAQAGGSGGTFLSTSLQRKRAKRDVWRLALVVFVFGSMVTALFAWRIGSAERSEAEAALAAQGGSLAHAVAAAFHQVVERSIAVGSLYQGSDEVTREEFRRFVSSFEPIPGMGGLGYMDVLTTDQLAAYQAELAQVFPGLRLFEIEADGDRVPVTPRGWHAILRWFEPEDAFGRPHGFDSTSEPNRLAALTRARDTGDVSVTRFLQLVSDSDDDGFLVYWPVTEQGGGEVVGFTVAPMDLTELIEGQVNEVLTASLDWEIDAVDGPVATGMTEEQTWVTVLSVGGQRWRLTVRPSAGSGIYSTGDRIRGVIFPGVVTTLLASIGVYLYRRKLDTQRELDRLRELTRAKDQFLATVSHELRTPLTGVLGFSALLRDSNGEIDERERRSMIASVASEAADLSAIIDDLLVAARSELDLLVITSVPVSLRAQVAQVLETAEGSSGQTVDFVGENTPGLVAMADPGRVRQIVRNLVTNASRYGGDRLEIRFGRSGDAVILEVADNGPGIPEREEERVFEPYYRVHDPSTQPAALGIGLSVARHLARLMDGDLTYRREDGLSVFRITLPAARSERARAAERGQGDHADPAEVEVGLYG